jgi:hypothetical protein
MRKEKENETILDLNSSLAKSMTHHNQTMELTTWFLTLSQLFQQDIALSKFTWQPLEDY